MTRAQTLVSDFLIQAKTRPDWIALRTPERCFTYQEVDRLSASIAIRLAQAGARAGEAIGLHFPRSVDQTIAALGALRLGGVCVPLDPSVPAARLSYIVDNSRCSLVLGTGSDTPEFLRHLPWLDIDLALANAPITGVDGLDRARDDDLACILYTSGSTGQPKGVELEHTGLHLVCAATAALLAPMGVKRLYRFFAPSFDAAMWETFIGLGHGIELFIDPSGPRALSPDRLVRLLNMHSIDCLITTPTYLMGLSDDRLPLPRVIISCGEAILPSLADRLSSRTTLINAYGPCEISVCATMGPVVPGDNPVGIGMPLPHVGVEIRTEQGNLASPGKTGEIVLTGPAVARGYRGASHESNVRFARRKLSRGKSLRTYATGDLGRQRSDGSFEFVGRKDNQVKVRGYRIEPEEIEASIGHLEGVSGAIVVAAGHGSRRQLIAFVNGDARWTVIEVKKALAALLPTQMLPQRVEIVTEFPQLPTGKADRKELQIRAEQVLAGDISNTGQLTGDDNWLRAVWSQALNTGPIQNETDFFELEGDSLAAIEILTAVSEHTGRQIDLQDLFDRPKFCDFEMFVEGSGRAD